MKTKFTVACLIAAMLPAILTTPIMAVDLLKCYPTQLAAGDTSHARPWEFKEGDIFHVSQFVLKIGDRFKVKTGSADLGVGHCADGAIWAVLIPREGGTLTSPVAKQDEIISHVWLRFHPKQIINLFPPDSVFADGNTNLTTRIRAIARAKMTSSWQSDGNALIPNIKDMTVYADTKDGSRRFFIVDTQAQTAEYVAAFDRQSFSQISATSIPSVVVKTVPEAGSKNVPPGEFEIKVTFSKEMTDGSWSWCDVWENSTPEDREKPKYDADHKTCMLKVKLEPNKTYGYWLNTEKYTNFRDAQGRPAVPYLLVFQTESQTEKTALSAAQKWLALIDDGRYSESWKQASAIFQGGVAEPSWENSMNTFRKPLGSLISRKLKSAQPMTELPGAPDGQYVVMQFETAFTNKKSAVETVTFMLEKDGQWRAAGYFIK